MHIYCCCLNAYSPVNAKLTALYTTSMGMPDAFYITYAKLRLNFSMVTVVFINTYCIIMLCLKQLSQCCPYLMPIPKFLPDGHSIITSRLQCLNTDYHNLTSGHTHCNARHFCIIINFTTPIICIAHPPPPPPPPFPLLCS